MGLKTIRERLGQRSFLADARAVAKEHHLSLDELLAPRFLRAKRARHQLWKRIREAYGCSFPELGWLFEVDHSTVLQAVNGKGKRRV